MILDKILAQKTAKYLLQINAIKLKPENPFTWVSGLKSPIYCDNRIALSYPDIRNFLSESLAKNIKKRFKGEFIIAAVATGAIGIGILVADKLNLPFIYVRPNPKKHGQKNQIEGFLKAGQRVLVIEDLISTGKSSLNAVKVLKEASAKILGIMSLFNYGFSLTKESFQKEKIELQTLCDYNYLLIEAMKNNKISKKEFDSLKKWRLNPENWCPNNP